MRGWKLAGVGLAVGAMVLAGCGGEKDAKPKFPLSGLQNYETAQGIYDDLAAGGVQCPGFATYTGSKFATSSGKCKIASGDGAGTELIMMVYNSDANKQQQIDLYKSFGKMAGGYGYVEGGNWLVNCHSDKGVACTAIAKILGGRTDYDPMF